MNLKDFITTVLVDVENGANDAASKTGRSISLNVFGTTGDEGVAFDVAVTAGKEISGKVGAEVLSIGGKAEGKLSNEEVSRVKFRIIPGTYFKK